MDYGIITVVTNKTSEGKQHMSKKYKGSITPEKLYSAEDEAKITVEVIKGKLTIAQITSK